MKIREFFFGKKQNADPKPAEPQRREDADDDFLIPLGGKPCLTVEDGNTLTLRSADEDTSAVYDARVSKAADGKTISTRAADSNFTKVSTASSSVPNQLQDWYMSNGFIGWQACALIAQHWLIEKCCAMPANDAVRNGYEITVADGAELAPNVIAKVKRLDKEMGVLRNCSEFVKFTNVFGIRVVMFKVESDDAEYYAKPFNIDGVSRGAYRGISQVDPYWMSPVLDGDDSSDPSSINFYNPTWWVINGQKVHRSHLHIGIGAQVADILKPSYYYGGVSLVQRIYERVYAAERTANEAPLLTMSKRTSILKVDTAKAALKFQQFAARILDWVAFRDNHGVKVIDKTEEMEQQDTSLADLDTVIMTQFQLVSAIAEVPATKLLGTSPKGFGASGDYEELSYHEKLESIQTEQLDALVARHHLLLCKSHGINAQLEAVWNPVGTKTPEQLAELNKKKAETGQILITCGVIAPDEERQRLRADDESGYSSLSDDAADEEIVAGLNEPDGTPVAESADVIDEDSCDDAINNDHVDQEAEPAQVAVESPRFLERGEPKVGVVQSLAESHSSGADPVDSPIVRVDPSVAPSVVGIHSTAQPQTTRAQLLVALHEAISSLTKISATGMDSDEGVKAKEWNGLEFFVETAKGDRRVSRSGEYVTESMPSDYGYIAGFKGADGDSIDCFFGPSESSATVYVMNQRQPEDGEFDEHKVFIGFDSDEAALECYNNAYSSDWKGVGKIVGLTVAEFKDWLNTGDLTKPI